MKSSLRILAITVGLFLATTSFSQTTPSTAKDGATSGASTASSAKTPASGAKNRRLQLIKRAHQPPQRRAVEMEKYGSTRNQKPTTAKAPSFTEKPRPVNT